VPDALEEAAKLLDTTSLFLEGLCPAWLAVRSILGCTRVMGCHTFPGRRTGRGRGPVRTDLVGTQASKERSVRALVGLESASALLPLRGVLPARLFPHICHKQLLRSANRATSREAYTMFWAFAAVCVARLSLGPGPANIE